MTPSGYRLRRATSDDLPQLNQLWRAAQLPAANLEKRFTEFQVAENDKGELVGAVGLQLSGKQGFIHSETIPDFAQADTLRPQLWERLQKVTRNHGLVRLWTRESAPFWRQQDFAAADATVIALRPAEFPPAAALTLKLKDDVSIESLMNDEFTQLRQLQAEERERTMQRARALKLAGTLFTLVFVGILVVCFIFFVRFRQQTGR